RRWGLGRHTADGPASDPLNAREPADHWRTRGSSRSRPPRGRPADLLSDRTPGRTQLKSGQPRTPRSRPPTAAGGMPTALEPAWVDARPGSGAYGSMTRFYRSRARFHGSMPRIAIPQRYG